MDSGTRHVYWVMEEAASEGLAFLFAVILPDTHLFVADLLSLVRYKASEIRMHMYCAEEYDMIPINFPLMPIS